MSIIEKWEKMMPMSYVPRDLRRRPPPMILNRQLSQGNRNRRSSQDYVVSIVTSTFFCQLLTGLICASGLSWQLVILTTEYMDYKTFSEVQMIKHREVRPPAFSVCLPFIENINWKLLGWNFTQDQWTSMRQVERDILTMTLQKNWTIRQLFNYTTDFQALKTRGWIRRLGSYEVERQDEFLSAQKYIKDDFVCYRIIHPDVKKGAYYTRSHQNTYGEEPGGLLSFSFNKSMVRHVTKLSIYLHQTDVFPRGDADFPFNFISTNVSTIFSNGSSYIGLTYSYMTLYALPPPYKTNCVNYKSLTTDPELESQEHCIHYCMRIKVLKKFNESSFTATFIKPQDYRIMSRYSVQLSRTKENEVDRIYQNCLNECPKNDCIQTRFLPALVSTRDSLDVTFLLQEPNGPECMVFILPKMSIMELYVQIMSVCGVWLGVSLVDIVVRGVNFVFKTPKSTSKARNHFNRPYY